MKPEIHLKRARCPIDSIQSGWAWTIVASNGASARGWYHGSHAEAKKKADDALKRLEKLHGVGRRSGVRSTEAALVRPGKAA